MYCKTTQRYSMSHTNNSKSHCHIVLEYNTTSNDTPLRIDISLAGSNNSQDITVKSNDDTANRLSKRVALDNIDEWLKHEQHDDSRFYQAIISGLLKDTTIEEMAEASCISVSTFKRRFRSRYSTSPHSWFVSQRLKIAYTLIISTNINVRELTMLCGFRSVSHFIALFRRRYSTTPLRLRRTCIKSKDDTIGAANIVIDIETF